MKISFCIEGESGRWRLSKWIEPTGWFRSGKWEIVGGAATREACEAVMRDMVGREPDPQVFFYNERGYRAVETW